LSLSRDYVASLSLFDRPFVQELPNGEENHVISKIPILCTEAPARLGEGSQANNNREVMVLRC
jgi:hypothetical protein